MMGRESHIDTLQGLKVHHLRKLGSSNTIRAGIVHQPSSTEMDEGAHGHYGTVTSFD